MTAYASTPKFAERHIHPRALALIIGGHVALLAAAMTVQMDLPDKLLGPDTKVVFIPLPPEPPKPQAPVRDLKPQPTRSQLDSVPRIVPVPAPGPRVEPSPMPLPLPGPVPGTGLDPRPLPLPMPDPVRVGPRFVTPASALKPPYPASKLRTEEEASLRLRLTIDSQGRVTSVEPVGSADRAFLEAARRHIVARWRYQPATEGGRAIASSTVVTLRFELD